MSTMTTVGMRPPLEKSAPDTPCDTPVGTLPEVSRLSVLSHIDPKSALAGEEHLIDAHLNGTEKKVAVALSGDKVIVSLGVRAGAYSRQHWQLIQEEGAQLHPEARDWLDHKSHRPNEGVWVRATAFKVESGKVTLGGGSLLFDSPNEADALHLTQFLQKALERATK